MSGEHDPDSGFQDLVPEKFPAVVSMPSVRFRPVSNADYDHLIGRGSEDDAILSDAQPGVVLPFSR